MRVLTGGVGRQRAVAGGAEQAQPGGEGDAFRETKQAKTWLHCHRLEAEQAEPEETGSSALYRCQIVACFPRFD